jgi:hypothetical protein
VSDDRIPSAASTSNSGETVRGDRQRQTVGLVSLMDMPYAVLMPIFAKEILCRDVEGLGILMGATGVGALAGALSLTFRTSVRGLGRVVAYASAGFGVSLILFSFSENFWRRRRCSSLQAFR